MIMTRTCLMQCIRSATIPAPTSSPKTHGGNEHQRKVGASVGDCTLYTCRRIVCSLIVDGNVRARGIVGSVDHVLQREAVSPAERCKERAGEK